MENANKINYRFELDHHNFILRDHRVHGVRIMPGVVFLDLIYRILKDKSFNLAEAELTNVIFLEPVAVTEESGRQVDVKLEKESDFWRVKALSRQFKEDGTTSSKFSKNMEAKLSFKKAAPPAAIDLEKLKAKAERTTDMEDLYAQVRKIKINHYEFMKALGEVHQNEDFLLAELRLGRLAEEHRNSFYFPPAYLDGSTLLPALFGEMEADQPAIPLHIASFRAFDLFQDKAWVYAKKESVKSSSKDIFYSDLEFYSQDGKQLAFMKGLAAKKIRSEELITRLTSEEAPQSERLREISLESQADDQQSFSSEIEKTDDLSRLVKEEIKGFLAKVSGKSASEFDCDQPFYDQGLDSSQLLETARLLEKRLNIELYPTLLFEYPSVGEIADYLIEEHKDKYQSVLKKRKPARLSAFKAPAKVEREVLGSFVKVESNIGDDIAVIGLGCRFPRSRDLNEFWTNIYSAENCVGEIPRDRWDFEPYFSRDPSEKNKIYSKWGGFVDGAESFDPLFFNISPRQAEMMDPQLRIMLEVAWETLEDAGRAPGSLAGSRVGVYAGVMNNDYTWTAAEQYALSGEYASAGCYDHELSNRLSYFFNFQGPSMTVETACSSSSTALHLARVALLRGECELALAGGVNLSLHRSKYLTLSRLNVLSPEGREKTFDGSADGYVPGEGAGLALLKPLSKAVEDGDRIYGIIKASSVNHSGRGAGNYVPSVKAISEAFEKSLLESGVEPKRLSYIETHGTGSALGDPLEIRALSRVFRKYTDDKNFCALGSKANFGHLESASGICSFIKVLLSFKNSLIPCCPNVEEVNPALDINESPFRVPFESEKWSEEETPRIAGINSFGIGGSNSFIMVEEFRSAEKPSPLKRDLELIVLSAKNKDRLSAHVERMVSFLENSPEEIELSDLAHTLLIGRDAMVERLALTAETMEELLLKLREFLKTGRETEELFLGNAKKGGASKPLISGISGRIFLKAAMEYKELDKLARFWVDGADIDWSPLYAENRPQTISLPAYPFAGERHRPLKNETGQFESRESEFKSSPRAGSAVKSSVCENLYLESFWRPAPTLGAEARFKGKLLIFAEDKALITVFRNKYPQARAVLVRPAKSYLKKEESYFIRLDQEEDYQTLIDDLSEANRLPDAVLSLALSAEEPKSRFYSLFYLLKALMKAKAKREIRLLALYENNSDQACFDRALGALGRTAAAEHPRFFLQTLGLDNLNNYEAVLKQAVPELSVAEKTTDVRYLENERQIKALRELSPRNFGSGQSAPRERGVYLITGGLGGLGVIVARYLGETRQAKLALIGRSALDDAGKAKLSEVEKTGAEAIYISADVSKPEEVEKAIAAAKERFGAINGVVHAAGALRDSMIINKNEKEIAAVFSSKLDGTLNLDSALKDEKLDFMVFFSSIAGVLGNVGQADYAYANAFLDEFAEERVRLVEKGERFGKTISIGWPHWAEGGMAPNKGTLKWMEDVMGLLPLSDKSGLRIFEESLSSDKSRPLAFQGDYEKLKERLNFKPAADLKTSTRELEEKLRDDLIDMASYILKVEKEHIDAEEDITNYGFDSIMLTTMVRKMEEKWEIEISGADLLEFTNITSISQYLAKNYFQSFASQSPENYQKTTPSHEKTGLQTSTVELEEKLRDDLIDMASYILKVDKEHIDAEEDITNYGFDSIMLTTMVRKMEEKWEIEISGADLLEFTNITSISQYLAKNYFQSFASQSPENYQKTTPRHEKTDPKEKISELSDYGSDIDSLSESELDELLKDELSADLSLAEEAPSDYDSDIDSLSESELNELLKDELSADPSIV